MKGTVTHSLCSQGCRSVSSTKRQEPQTFLRTTIEPTPHCVSGIGDQVQKDLFHTQGIDGYHRIVTVQVEFDLDSVGKYVRIRGSAARMHWSKSTNCSSIRACRTV